MNGPLEKLREIHSALDQALGDSDITWMDEDEMREEEPVQWAATQVARLEDEVGWLADLDDLKRLLIRADHDLAWALRSASFDPEDERSFDTTVALLRRWQKRIGPPVQPEEEDDAG